MGTYPPVVGTKALLREHGSAGMLWSMTPHIGASVMSELDRKVLENRLRRAADRQRLRLLKCRRRDPRASDYGTYMLIDARTMAIVHGDRQHGYGLALTDVADYLED